MSPAFKVFKLQPLRRSQKQMPARSLETWTEFKGEGHLTDVTTKFRPQANAGMPSSSLCTQLQSVLAVEYYGLLGMLLPADSNL